MAVALAGVHRPCSTPDLERRLRDLLPPLGLKASRTAPTALPVLAPAPTPTPSPTPSPAPSPAPSRAASRTPSPSPLSLSAQQLQDVAARQARLDAALRSLLQGDEELQEVRARRRQLEVRQRLLESELQVQRQVLQGTALLGLPPAPEAGAGGACAGCRRLAERERRLRLQEQQLKQLRAQTEAEQRQLQAHRAALDWERNAHATRARAPSPARPQGDAEFSWLGLLCCCC